MWRQIWWLKTVFRKSLDLAKDLMQSSCPGLVPCQGWIGRLCIYSVRQGPSNSIISCSLGFAIAYARSNGTAIKLVHYAYPNLNGGVLVERGLHCLYRTLLRPRRWTLRPYFAACPSRSNNISAPSKFYISFCHRFRNFSKYSAWTPFAVWIYFIAHWLTQRGRKDSPTYAYPATGLIQKNRYVRMKADKDMFIIMQLIQVKRVSITSSGVSYDASEILDLSLELSIQNTKFCSSWFY